MIRLPDQLEPTHDLVRSWTTDRPTFFGFPLTLEIIQCLIKTENLLASGITENLDPSLCRVLAAYHGPKGAKVPLSLATVSGCVRPAFVARNPWLVPNSLSCYDGGCYLFHARAVPAKSGNEYKVRAHMTPHDGLLGAALVSKRYNLPIRDNQSSDGSLSMGMLARGQACSQLYLNLQTLAEAGHTEVPYLCFSSAYIRVPKEALQNLSQFPNLVVHVTVSGWHSREENNLRLQVFDRYAHYFQNTFLRVVNRQDWAGIGGAASDSGARLERWLLKEIEYRGFAPHVIRTPFHSVHPFPGGKPGCLGTRHMAGTEYSDSWERLYAQGARSCCTTGKCKTCPTGCGLGRSTVSPDSLLAARAFESLLQFENIRQQHEGETPLALYTKRLLARKGAELYASIGDSQTEGVLRQVQEKCNCIVKKLPLSSIQRRRLVNDSHALVIDGIDRHRLWAKAAKRVTEAGGHV
jgi:hypothetical protein